MTLTDQECVEKWLEFQCDRYSNENLTRNTTRKTKNVPVGGYVDQVKINISLVFKKKSTRIRSGEF